MAFQPKYLVLHDYGTNTPYGGGNIEFNPYHALVRGGQVQYRYPDNPYGQKAPHAYHLNPQAIGLSWYGPVGGKPGEDDLKALQAEVARIKQQFPDIQLMGHGEAYAKRGEIPQASKHGRDLEEASWRAFLDGVLPATPANPNRGGSMNGGMGMSPLGVAGVAGPVQTQAKGHSVAEQPLFKEFGMVPASTPTPPSGGGGGGGDGGPMQLPFGYKLASAEDGAAIPAIPKPPPSPDDPLAGIDWGGADFSKLFALAQQRRKIGVG